MDVEWFLRYVFGYVSRKLSPNIPRGGRDIEGLTSFPGSFRMKQLPHHDIVNLSLIHRCSTLPQILQKYFFFVKYILKNGPCLHLVIL